jgi:alanyl-tRNA synthetase
MKGSEIRKQFLEYFVGKGHRIVKSSSLIPKNDPTLLFTNAGMVQFKDVYLGVDKRDYKRATSAQKCLRAGGKHNDLENVGYTARHHTFFEMLGNFSFGDYFKNEAIDFAWELITEIYKLPTDRLWATVYEKDDEAYDIWNKKIGLSSDRIVRLGEKDNFWAMGETGPCGPCSEIVIDQGESLGCGKEDCRVGCDCDRYLELWNLVFMQYVRDSSGKLTSLPNPSIDTGMGLERITAIIQGVKSNYDTDLLRGIIRDIEEIVGKSYRVDPPTDISMRVIADHARAVTFLISDGVLPLNEGRGYVLRRILRRAVRHARMLDIKEPFLYKLANRVKDIMKDSYPEIEERIGFVEEVVRNEEVRFLETIDRGLDLLNSEVQKRSKQKILPGNVVFKLYDTYGFPVDLTEDIAKEHGLEIDSAGFEKEMEKQKKQSRLAWKGPGEEELTPIYKEFVAGGLSVIFTGYEKTTDTGRITAIIRNGGLVDSINAGENGELITDTTPFYGESGGQVGDKGIINSDSGSANVLDTVKPFFNLIVHHIVVKKGTLWVGDKVELSVDNRLRYGAKTHHTTTHMLHAVLRELLGSHVRQAGSLVAPERLRFDFTHFSPIDEDTIRRIEDTINDRIRWDDEVTIQTDVPYDEAIARGATAIFEEKYGDRVRVVTIGDYSKELCGGTHLHTSGEVGLFKILHETSSSAGIRRIEAVAGESGWKFIRKQEETLNEASDLLRVPKSDLIPRLKKMIEENISIKDEVKLYKSKMISSKVGELLERVEKINGINVLSAEVPGEGPEDLRKVWDDIRAKFKNGIAALGCRSDGKAYILIGVTKELIDKYHAGKIVKELASIIGGGGGGRADMAQAGGNMPDNLNVVLRKFYDIVSGK